MAGSVTNRKVFTDHETAHYRNKHGISKDPFAAIRYKDLKEPLFMVRHPMAVLTSIHPKFKGEHGFYWNSKDKRALQGPKRQRHVAPYGLDQHYKALGTPIYKYEDLCTDPDRLQAEIGAQFGLEYSRKWSEWPYGDLSEYWQQSLGDLRPIHPAREWTGKTVFPGVQEAIERLGYE